MGYEISIKQGRNQSLMRTFQEVLDRELAKKKKIAKKEKYVQGIFLN